LLQNTDLKEYIETSPTVELSSFVQAEINLNSAEIISKIGNYRYRPIEDLNIYSATGDLYTNTYDPSDMAGLYTGATDADIAIDGGFNDDGTPYIKTLPKEKEKLLFSLEDCFNRFRPRSGIHKVRHFSLQTIDEDNPRQYNFTHYTNQFLASRPRFYVSDRNDKFKYWTSYRSEEVDGATVIRGLSSTVEDEENGGFYMNDASPFIVYNKAIPVNRIVVKMQTYIAEEEFRLGPFEFPEIDAENLVEDPFVGESRKIAPVYWTIEGLVEDTWTELISFDKLSTRSDQAPVIGADGYVEIAYGLTDSETYGWFLYEDALISDAPHITQTVNPPTIPGGHKEFQYLKGLRIVVHTMSKKNAMFELIELSPRLSIDMSDRVSSFSVNKIASDVGVSGLPVGQLLASTGNLEIFDFDQSFSDKNPDSILGEFPKRNVQFKFYEILDDKDEKYYVPIKVLYTESFPESSIEDRTLSLQLRDLFFYFENTSAPELLVKNASLSFAVSLLLDSIGFSNYVFKRVYKRDEDGQVLKDTDDNEIFEDDPIIPYFFIAPDKSVAEILNSLAVSTQSSMYFDEYNNFVVMSKEYTLPDEQDRPTDITLYGSKDTSLANIDKIENIVSIGSKENNIFNDGKINYSTRYIQRSYGSIREANVTDRDKTWIYKPSLLWEIAGLESTKSINEELTSQSTYVLAAIPLSETLSDRPPEVVDGQIINNYFDLGEGVYWIARYNGYFYANKEVLRYDAVEYAVDGLGEQFITSVQEYQNFFSKVPFRGRIYPTGRVRIYSEPNYEVVEGITRLQDGPVAKHGRGQFGTEIVSHPAGPAEYWLETDKEKATVNGCVMEFKYALDPSLELPTTIAPSLQNIAGQDFEKNSFRTTRNGIIKNFLSGTEHLETPVNTLYSTQTGTIQSSALVMSGPVFEKTPKPNDFISYIYKPLDNKYKSFGTRMRIIGKQENDNSRIQSPSGSSTYYNARQIGPAQNYNVGGASGGMSILLNPKTNSGYFFEIAALTENNVNDLGGGGDIANVFFYKTGFSTQKDYESSYEDLTTTSGNVEIQYDELSRTIVSKVAGRFKIDDETDTIARGSRIFVNDGPRPGYYRLTRAGKADVGLIPGSTWRLSLDEPAIPITLYRGFASILVDDGLFTGQHRFTGEDSPTVFDLSVEYEETLGGGIEFTLFLNNKIIARVFDKDPLPIHNNMALFNRGSSKCMFEHIYAVAPNYTTNVSSGAVDRYNESGTREEFRRFTMTRAVISSYLSGITTSEPPKFDMFYDEFGTIMREASYFNVKYDKAFPAIYSQLSPTFNSMQGYVVSGYTPSAYRAEFLIFNITDTALSLDESTGNYLRIQGITFTQQSTHSLSVDEYFSKKSDFSNPVFVGERGVQDVGASKKTFQDIKNSRATYGKNEFSLDTPYLQSQDAATEMMGWLVSKITKPRKSIGIKIFANPMIQLGDIVNIYYKKDSKDEVAKETDRFVIYQIEYSRSQDGPEMTVYLSEVA
jgi:hypothetical protein